MELDVISITVLVTPIANNPDNDNEAFGQMCVALPEGTSTFIMCHSLAIYLSIVFLT
jgi:hypothetical protein